MVTNKWALMGFGLLSGLSVISITIIIFVVFVAKVELVEGWLYLHHIGQRGKLIVIGALPNVLIYIFCVQKQYDNFAKGILIATLLAGIYTIF